MEFLRARRAKRYALVINDPQPVKSLDGFWLPSAQAATIGIFVLLLGTFFYFARTILLPVTAAIIVGVTLSPLVKAAQKRGISPWVTTCAIVLFVAGVFGVVVTIAAAPVSEWITRAPDIGAVIKQKLYVLDQPLAAARAIQDAIFPHNDAVKVAEGPSVVVPVVAFVTPALVEMMLFFGTLLFILVGQSKLRGRLIAMFSERDAKLRVLRISNDIEYNLVAYLGAVTVINVGIGIAVAIICWAVGLPSPLIFGVVATILNYLPYIGPAVTAFILFATGLMIFPSLGAALTAPLCFVALATLEGHLITPMVIGRRLTLNPLTVFLAIAFWTWMWGPIGAFLAVPLSIVAMVTVDHLFPEGEGKLPE